MEINNAIQTTVNQLNVAEDTNRNQKDAPAILEIQFRRGYTELGS